MQIFDESNLEKQDECLLRLKKEAMDLECEINMDMKIFAQSESLLESSVLAEVSEEREPVISRVASE